MLRISRYWQKLGVTGVMLFLFVVGCDRASETERIQANDGAEFELRIWWDKGYVLEEDEAIEQVVSNWEQKTGYSVQFSFYAPDEIARKASRASKAGNPPDIMFSSRAEYALFAWDGELANVSDVIEPVEDLYSWAALQAAYLYNQTEQKRSYYAVPLHQATIHIFYWRDLLRQVGLGDRPIPRDWEGFWQFWQQAQNNLRSQQPDIYGLGLPMSIGASDTYYLFEQILEAYNVQLLDAQGQLQLDEPTVRQGIINTLDWYTNLYQQGYIPPSALQWLDPDNNRSLLNRAVFMTPNPTLSIPLALQLDQDTYQNKLGILEFPLKPNGQPMRHLVSVRQAVVFAHSPNQAVAKDFLRYLIQPEVMEGYLKSAGGRYLPVMDAARQDPLWTDPNDPHLATATKTFQGQTRLFYSVQNPAYSVVLKENVWGKALNKIVNDGVASEQAADEAIAEIEEIFAQWQ